MMYDEFHSEVVYFCRLLTINMMILLVLAKTYDWYTISRNLHALCKPWIHANNKCIRNEELEQARMASQISIYNFETKTWQHGVNHAIYIMKMAVGYNAGFGWLKIPVQTLAEE
jgi:hypothetical protein